MQAIAQTLPPEILRIVFRQLVQLDKEEKASEFALEKQENPDWMRYCGGCQDFHGHSTTVMNCLLVCRAWLEPAKRVLYEGTIQLTGTTERTEFFSTSILRQPALSTWLQSLDIGIPDVPAINHAKRVTYSSKPRFQSRSLLLVDLLRSAPNLRHLLVSDIAKIAKEPFMRALLACRRLKTLKFSRYGGSVGHCADFILSDLYSVLGTLPELKSLKFSNVHSSEPHLPLPNFHPVARLSSLHLLDAPMTDAQFVSLMQDIAPTLSYLRIQHETYMGRIDYYSLEALETGIAYLCDLESIVLRIFRILEEEPSPPSSRLFSNHTKLQNIYTTTDVASLGLFSTLPATTERLDIRLTSYDHSTNALQMAITHYLEAHSESALEIINVIHSDRDGIECDEEMIGDIEQECADAEIDFRYSFL